MSELNETLLNTNILLGNVLLYALPAALIILTAIVFSGIVEKFGDSAQTIAASIKSFAGKLLNKKFKLSLLVLTIVYCAAVVAFLVLR